MFAEAAGMDAEGWVLAGGQSRRMGTDKAAAMLNGRPLLEHMLGKLTALGLRVRVAGLRGTVEGSAAAVVADAHPDCGPLSGLETALGESDRALVLVVGVDLPLVSAEFLQWMLERAARTAAMATMPRLLGQAQPLCAVYRRELLGAVSRALEAGDFKMRRVVEAGAAAEGGRVDIFDAERLATTGALPGEWPLHWQLMNCNTPADLTLAATRLARAPML